MARLNAENIKNFLYELNEKKIPKKRFNSKILYNLLKIFFLIIVSDILYYAPLAFVWHLLPT
jgi:NADH:ubiquinone oxidoreductase subunit 3 (subunit A)